MAYDHDLQSPAVQERYAPFTPAHMAALALRAMDVDWETVTEALTIPDEEATFIEDRLHNDFFAGRALGFCYSEGLLRAEVISDTTPGKEHALDLGEIDPRYLTANQLTALRRFAKGAISRYDRHTLLTLQHLKESSPPGSNLLSLLTKTAAVQLIPTQSAEIITYRRSLTKVPDDVARKMAAAAQEEKRRKASLPLRFAGSTPEKLGDSRRAFVRRLELESKDWADQAEPAVTWKGTTFTFHLPELTREQRTATILSVFGMSAPEIASITERPNVESIHATVQRKLRMPVGLIHGLGLFLLNKEYLKYDQPVALRSEPYAPNVHFLEVTMTRGERPNLTRGEKSRALRYLYNEIGVTCMPEALLALETNNLLQPLDWDNLQLAKRSRRS